MSEDVSPRREREGVRRPPTPTPPDAASIRFVSLRSVLASSSFLYESVPTRACTGHTLTLVRFHFCPHRNRQIIMCRQSQPGSPSHGLSQKGLRSSYGERAGRAASTQGRLPNPEASGRRRRRRAISAPERRSAAAFHVPGEPYRRRRVRINIYRQIVQSNLQCLTRSDINKLLLFP